MRRGEILSMKWSDIGHQSRSLLIPTTKTGQARTSRRLWPTVVRMALAASPAGMSGDRAAVYCVEGYSVKSSSCVVPSSKSLSSFRP